MSAITTHVLDTARGGPARSVSVLLERSEADAWTTIGGGQTDTDGRLRTLMADSVELTPGIYRLTFDTRRYFDAAGVRAFYPQVIVMFEVTDADAHYHVPLLLSPFGFSTYRGT